MPTRDRIKLYHALAVDLRAKAADGKWWELRDHLMELARQYDLLAESVERVERSTNAWWLH
jgi:hypothetical protein